MAEFEFSAFIENLSSRTRGIISGVWLHFPTTKQLVHEALRFIGVDGLRNEETIFTDYRIAIPELRSVMVEYNASQLGTHLFFLQGGFQCPKSVNEILTIK